MSLSRRFVVVPLGRANDPDTGKRTPFEESHDSSTSHLSLEFCSDQSAFTIVLRSISLQVLVDASFVKSDFNISVYMNPIKAPKQSNATSGFPFDRVDLFESSPKALLESADAARLMVITVSPRNYNSNSNFGDIIANAVPYNNRSIDHETIKLSVAGETSRRRLLDLIRCRSRVEAAKSTRVTNNISMPSGESASRPAASSICFN